VQAPVLGLRSLADLLVIALAVWRLSYMFVWEDGPFDLIRTLREQVGVRIDPHTNLPIVPDHVTGVDKFFAGIFSCVYCLSVWTAIFFTGLYLVNSLFAVVLAVPFALSACAIAINSLYDDYG